MTHASGLLRAFGAAAAFTLALSLPALAQEGYGDVSKGVRARQAQVIDNYGFEKPLTAFTILVPSHWLDQGGIEWGVDDGCNAFGWRVNWAAYSPDTEYGVAMLPSQSWSFAYNAPPFNQCPQLQINSASDYLMWRASMIGEDIRVIGYQNRLDILQAIGQPPGQQARPDGTVMQFDAGELHFTYLQEGTRYEAMMSTAIVISTVNFQGFAFVTGNTVGVFLSAAPENKLNLEMAHLMEKSVAQEPEWGQKIAEYQSKVLRAKIASMQPAQRSSTQAQGDVNDALVNGYNERSDMNDVGHREEIEGILGVETYDDPVTGQPVQLDNNYQRAWRLDDGTYLLSNDANLEPFRDLGIDGQALQVAQ